MAFVTTFLCGECRQQHEEVVTPSRICVRCRTAIADSKRTAHMSRLAALPVEERVRRIELALYELDAEDRIKALEAKHARY